MRHHAFALTALLVAGAEIVAASCNPDNCLRALRATQTPGRLQSAQAFCATFTAAPVAPTNIPEYAASGCKANQNGDTNARLSSACACIAPTATAPAGEPCAQVSSLWASQVKATSVPVVDAEVAHKCLNSVPLNKQAAIELVDSIEPYLEWQSDAAYKANPPKDYFYPGYDMFANLATVKSNLQNDKYANEYEFQTDLYVNVFAKGHDGHFYFYPDILTRTFKWRRHYSLVSISEDGASLPVIKLYEDVVANPKTAQVVSKINGIEAAKYVEDTTATASYNQDIDTAYNSMFYETPLNALAGLQGYFNGGGRVGYLYQGANTTITFKNGTTIGSNNLAAVIGDMTGVVDGPSFYKKFCTPQNPAPGAPGPPTNLAKYPKPVIQSKDGIVSGYYLDGEGLDDVAVIVLLAFENESPAEFQAVAQDFYNEAKAAGKTKLVIDFQGNGGGYILQGYDFYRQLFPHIQEDGFSRWKGNDAFLSIAKIISDELANFDPYTSANEDLINNYESWFNYRYDLNLTNDNFLTFDDKFAAQTFQDTRYTALMRWNLSDPLTTTNETFGMGIEISGYGSLKNLTQPFEAENIVIVYDGICASTCTIASEMLRIQGGVKSVAFGGRPKEGPIQGVGGVKGSQVLNWSNIYSYASSALSSAKDPKDKAALSRYSRLPMLRSTASGVNVRDQILRDNVNDGKPAQFVVEEADCRLYWTAPMISDIKEVWKAAANSAFNGAKCAHGGIEHSGKRATTAIAGEAGHRVVPRRSEAIAQNIAPFQRSEAWLAQFQQKVIIE